MIEIVWAALETRLTLSADRPQLLIIENPHEFYRVVDMLATQFDGGEGEFVFLGNGERVAASKVGDFVLDVFHLDFNDKKVLGLLYKKLEKNYQTGAFICALNKINSEAGNFLEDLFFTTSLSLSYEEMQISDILKSYTVRVQKTYETFLEKLICYINLLVELKNIETVCFVNLKSVLNDKDLMQLYSHCQNENIAVLLIESAKIRPLLKLEKAIIITEDLCEIVENYMDL